jgi:zinc protease
MTWTGLLVVALTVLFAIVATAAGEDEPMPTTVAPPPTPTARSQVAVDPAAGAIRVADYLVLQDRGDRLIAELPNRMIVMAQRVAVAPVASVQVWVQTGSIYEQEHVGAGLSHFLEHLLSGGSTATRPESESNAILGRIGARTNAATGLDTVHYYINTTADHAGDAIDLLSDWMLHAVITQAEYEREREVIHREFEHGAGDPNRIFWRLTQQARYQNVPGHPARHPTIGYLDEFDAITRDEIYDFYRRMYVPNNLVFVVAGDIDPREAVAQVARNFRDAQPGELPAVALPGDGDDAPAAAVVGHADIRRPRVRLAWPGTMLAADGDYALDLLGGILGDGESSRLTRTIRDHQRLVNTIDAYNQSFTWGEGFFGVDAEAASADTDLDALVAAILEQLTAIQNDGVTEEELARAKRKTLARVIYLNQSAEGIATRLARDVIGTGDPDYLPKYAQAIQELTAADVQAAAKRFIHEDRMIRVTLLPLPPGEKPTELVRPDEPDNLDTSAWRKVELDNTALLARLSESLGEAGASRTLTVDPVQMHVLDNGLRVLIGRSTVVPAVAMQWFQLGGLLADEHGREGVASAATTMLMKGTTTRTAEEISRTLEDLGAGLSTQTGNNSVYAQAVALRDDYPTVLGLMADVVLNASFPDDEWEKLRPRLVAAIERQSDRWSGELGQKWRAAYYDGHVWSQTALGRRDVVASLKAEELRSFHASRLGAAGAVVAVFGDVEPAEALAQVAAAFGAMPRESAAGFTAATPAPPQPRLVIEPTAKPMAAVQIGFGPGITRQSDDYAAMQVLARLLSDFPSGKLEGALRGDGPGLVYAVGAYNMTGIVPGSFNVVFNTQPATVAEALGRVMRVVEEVRSTAASDDEIARAKASVRVDEALSKQANGDRATSYALDVLYGLPLDDTERMLQRVADLDAQSLLDVARRYLTHPVVVVMSHTDLPREELEALLPR